MQVVIASLTLVALVGCSSSNDSAPAQTCVANLRSDCAPLYDPPTYDTIFTKILKPTCASGQGSCHTSDAAKGGLVFEDEDRTYALLLGQNGEKARVTTGDPACSLLVERLESSDPSYRMPPGSGLLAGERCTIERWIAAGAAR